MIEIESASHGRPGLASLEPSDHELVARLFGRLSPESVYQRFFSPITRPDQFIASVLRTDHHAREAVARPARGRDAGGGGRTVVPPVRDRGLGNVGNVPPRSVWPDRSRRKLWLGTDASAWV